MANGITTGKSGTFVAELMDNGEATPLPTGSKWAWSSSDAAATITADPSDATGATADVAIPATDTSTTITVTASTTDPTGATQSGSITVPISSQAPVFTVTVSQLS